MINHKVDEIRVDSVHPDWASDSDLQFTQLHLARFSGYGFSVASLSSVTYLEIKTFKTLTLN